MWQDYLLRMTLIAESKNEKASLLAELRNKIAMVPGHGAAPVEVETLTAHLSHTALAPLRIATVVTGAFGAIAILLCVIGLIAVLTDAVYRRRRELAICIALGASRGQTVYRVIRAVSRIVCVGIAVGMILSVVMMHFLKLIVPGTSPQSLWVWLAGPIALVVMVGFASVLPARGALLVNPLMIMREDA
jgi:ABC-type antimicrobial peptide transport system permease subunit